MMRNIIEYAIIRDTIVYTRRQDTMLIKMIIITIMMTMMTDII
jgi:hypothetical protein